MGRFAHFPVRPESFRPESFRPESFRPPLHESFRPPTLSRFAHYLMSRFARFLNLYFIEAIVINLQSLFPSMKILFYFFKTWYVLHQLKQIIHMFVLPLSWRANWVMKMSFHFFSLFYNDLLDFLQFSWTLYVFELDTCICLGISLFDRG